VADLVARSLGRRPAIRSLRRHEILALAERIPYYRPRVVYMAAAGRVVDDLIARHRAATALELGPHLRPLVVGADVMELEAKPDLAAEGRQIVHDATVAPWPIPDRAYDLFVGLQVFEHLRDAQPAAFREVRRVARHAVLSLPIDWQMPDPTNIHHEISHERVLGWFAPVRPTMVVLGNAGPRKRLIYVFEDLPAPDGEAGSVAGAGLAASDQGRRAGVAG
jgi:hypothetical protein